MGILASYVQARFPLNAAGQPQALVDLTNPGVETATTVNTVQLGYAETDVIAEFTLLTGSTFDTTGTLPESPQQLVVCYAGMISRLMDLKGLPRSTAAKAQRDEWEKLCVRYDKMFGSHAVQSPRTNATATPSVDCPGLPYFDRRVLENFVPRSPYPSGDCGSGCGGGGC